MTEKNEKDSLSRCDHLQLEAYRTHNQWNDHDGKNMIGMDAIVAAVAAGFLFRASETLDTIALKVLATVFLSLILIMWALLYFKFSRRMNFRYKRMRAIECNVGFHAHREVKSYIDTHCLQKLVMFFWVRIAFSAALLGFVCFSIWVGKKG